MYLIVKNGKLIESEERKRNEDYFLLDANTKHIYSLNLYDVVVVDSNRVDIGLKRFNKEDLILYRLDEMTDILNAERPQMVTKDAERKMLDPTEHNYRPFTRAVLMAVKSSSRRRALKRDDYDKILGLIREFNKCADGKKDVSPKKAEELLECYGLTINDIIREEYL